MRSRSNAKAHARHRYVLNIDLKDFFGSINFGRVRGILMSSMYGTADEVATTIAQICCHKDSLPQGAPTSPVVSNMVCGKLDAELKALAREFGCTYSRYCDDITLSTERGTFPKALASVEGLGEERCLTLGDRLISIINRNGFQINEAKSRLLSRSDRQEVTGLTVNRFANIPRKYIRSLRGALHAWQTYGLSGAASEFQKKYDMRTRGQSNFESVVFGRIQYVGAVRGFDDEIYRRFRNLFNSLSSIQIPIHKSSRDFKLEKSIWVLEFNDGDLPDDISQGTAFFLEGVGLVTCAHCVGNNTYIYHPSDPSKHYDVIVVAKSDDIDLAVLDVPEPLPAKSLGFSSASDSNFVQRGDRTTLAGFPQFGPGSHLSVKEGHIQSIKMTSGIRRFNLSTPIIGGNSGGPVFNNRGQVIGVAVTGADDVSSAQNTDANGVIPIAALEHLKMPASS